MVTFESADLDGGIKHIRLGGSLDIQGTEQIDLKMTALTSTGKQFVLLDLSDVSLMASLGIGLIYRCLKAIRLRGGNIVLVNPQPAVALVLERTNAGKVVAIVDDLVTACARVKEVPGGPSGEGASSSS
jgi:anti-anti-sigma factor